MMIVMILMFDKSLSYQEFEKLLLNCFECLEEIVQELKFVQKY
jgi:hypothetical protein